MALLAVQLQGLWFTDMADPRDALVVPVEVDSGRSLTVTGEVLEFAGGTFRSVVGAGRRRGRTPKIGLVPLTVAEQLEARAGRPQWVRGPTGDRIAAQFFDPVIAEQGPLLLPGYGEVFAARISLTLQGLTASEVV